MALETQEDELVRLRAELEARKAQDLADLKSALIEARQHVEHYRAEAHRNAEVGRQIATNYQQQVLELQAKIEALHRIDSNVRRFGTEPGG